LSASPPSSLQFSPPATSAPRCPPRPPAARPRSAALDVARGIGIVLVVWGHAIIGVQGALGSTPSGRFALTAIYAVHMPLFFFLSGLLSRSASAEPARAFALRMATRIVYPYLLWGTVILALHHAMSEFTNTRVDSLDLLTLLYRPPAVLWFLYVLFACFLLARTLRRLAAAPRLAVGGALCVAGALLDAWLLPYLRFVGIFIIATALDPARLPALVGDRALALASLGLASGLAFAIADAAAPLRGYPAAGLRYLPSAAGGVLLVLAASRHLPSRAARLLEYLGTRTMPIFVTHILILAAVRILLVRAGWTDAALVVAVATPLALALPALAVDQAERLGLVRVLGWR
jgi:fucose 4-O-acetylase-like acetyltransferase